MDAGTETLSMLVNKSLNIYNELVNTMEPSNSRVYQDQVKKAILMLEDATRCASSLGLFSQNETVEEVATEDLKFFLLPVLLGDLNLKLLSEDRLNLLNVAEVYYKDFLKRCKEYTVSDVRIPDDNEVEEEEPRKRTGPLTFEEMAVQRELKIKEFKEKKLIESRLCELKAAIENPSSDETTRREYYLLLLKKFIHSALEELKSISQEKPILEHIIKMKSEGEHKKYHSHVVEPLKPIIITRDAVQKTVYGIGYPSIPAMTVDELIQQRLQEGWYEKTGITKSQGISLQDQAKNYLSTVKKEEEEEIEKEKAVEEDNPEQLNRARQFDEWKDEHRRGWGNRHNMG